MKNTVFPIKKLSAFLVVAVMTASLAACGPSGTPTPGTPVTPAGTPKATTTATVTARPSSPAATAKPATPAATATAVAGTRTPTATPAATIVTPTVQPTTGPAGQVTPPVVATPGTATPKATAAAGQSPTPIPIVGTPPVSGAPYAPVPIPSIPATTTGPAIIITYPENFASFHTTVNNRDVMVVVQTVNFNLVNKIGQANVPGEGHIVYYLDANPPTQAGGSALTAPGSYFATTSTAMMWANLPFGPHKIAAQLVNNDNTPLSPARWSQIQTYVTYNIGSPAVKIVSPAMGATVSGSSVTVNLQVTDFVVVAKQGQPDLPGQGHIVYYMDVEPPIAAGQTALTGQGTFFSTTDTSHTWTNVPPGVHTFSAQLVTNIDTPLSLPPTLPAIDQVVVTVQ